VRGRGWGFRFDGKPIADAFACNCSDVSVTFLPDGVTFLPDGLSPPPCTEVTFMICPGNVGNLRETKREQKAVGQQAMKAANESNVVSLQEYESALSRGDAFVTDDFDLLREAKQSLELQAAALSSLADRLGASYQRALRLLLCCRGRIVVCGIGKSGLVGRKLAATLASTGTPSTFLHPAEALHGDLGMVQPDDVVVFICYSGETAEVTRLLPCVQALKVHSIALVGRMKSTLARTVDVALDVSVEREACPHNLAPTTSTLASLAMGDSLAMSLMRLRGFSKEDFGRYHPGGSLGRRVARVGDAMRKDELPMVLPSTSVEECLFVMAHGRLGLAIVVNDCGDLCGIVTDGDLRRNLAAHKNLLNTRVSEIMTDKPITISENAPLVEAEERMQSLRLKALIVLNGESRVAGVIEVFK
jgi:arabinose-5-phosphate isomerase